MEGFHEGFVSFWETLTGVLDDDRSKIIRLSCFVLLFLGIIWAGLNYFQAERISNLDEDMDSYSAFSAGGHSSDTLDKLTEIAQTVGTMRRGGEAIAESLSSMNTMPFNIEGYNELGLEDLNTTAHHQQGHTGSSPLDEQANANQEQQQQEKQPPQIMVKALMLSGKNKYAVIDYAAQKGKVIRQGQKLPDGEGRVVRINQEGITVRMDNKEVVYTVK